MKKIENIDEIENDPCRIRTNDLKISTLEVVGSSPTRVICNLTDYFDWFFQILPRIGFIKKTVIKHVIK